MPAAFCIRFYYTTVQQYKTHFTTKFYLINSENNEIMLFESRQHPISQRSIVMQNRLQANCPRFIETRQIWTHWTSASELSCLGCHAGTAA